MMTLNHICKPGGHFLYESSMEFLPIPIYFIDYYVLDIPRDRDIHLEVVVDEVVEN